MKTDPNSTALVQMLGPLLNTEEGEIDDRGIRQLVAARLRWIIDNHFAKLADLLYRFDIDERRVERAFAAAPAEMVHEALADLVLDRAREKIRSRTQRRGEP